MCRRDTHAWAGLCLLSMVLGTLAILAAGQPAFGAAEVHLADDSLLGTSSPAPQKPRPVLFIHGHNLLSADDADFNYRKNWHDSLNGLPSFKQTLDAPENAWLDIEPYYIRFQEQGRSIVEDARDIADAVERILARHDPSHTAQTPSTTVKVALIGFSKGTISGRLYLKSLHQQQYDLPAPRPGFNPVSEFVALAPPNHGLAAADLLAGFSPPLRQLNNGYRENCTPYLTNGESRDFIASLNGHPIGDTMRPASAPPSWTPGQFPQEAPGSRVNGDSVAAGTLYLTLFADLDRDLVGGATPSNDCQGRVLALNLAPHAVNVEVPDIPGAQGSADAHQNTPHTPAVICIALSTIVHHKAPPPDFRCQPPGQLPRIPPRAAVMPLLDVSGSMLWPACSTCDPKLDVLKEAVELFTQLWGVLAGPGDRIGATYFGTQVSSFAVGGDPLIEVSAGNLTALLVDVQGRTTVPTNLTAMGGGLQTGVQVLQGPGGSGIPQRHLILFTDGMQNVNPTVVRVDDSPPPGASHLEIANVPGRPASNVVPSQPPTRLDAALGMRVHTVGVGATFQFIGLLAEIAQATNGSTRVTTDPDQDLRQFFVEEVIESLHGNSPQLVAYRRGLLEGTEGSERFRAGKGARRVVLKLSWKRKERLTFRVEKDGVDVSGGGRFIEGSFYRLFVADTSGGRGARPVSSEGEWHMRISGRGGTRYEAAAIVDEPNLRYRMGLDRKVYVVGDPLAIRMTVSVGGRPAAGPNRVVATVLKPGDSAGNLLSRHPIAPDASATFPEGAGPVDRKLHLLLRDDRLWRTLQPQPRTVPLEARGDGTYAGTFAATTIPGAYRVVVTIHGSDPDIGEFQRTESLTALVGFGPADLAVSQLRVIEIARDRAGRHLRLSLKPMDRYGNYLGPGHADGIRVFVASGTVGSTPLDGSDGTYMVPLHVPATSDPVIAVWVMDHLLVQDTLSRLGSSWWRDWKWWSATVLLAVAVLGLAWPLIGQKLIRASP